MTTSTTAAQAEPKRRGRPPAAPDDTRSGRLAVRALKSDLATWQACADAAQVSLSKWVTDACRQAAATTVPPSA